MNVRNALHVRARGLDLSEGDKETLAKRIDSACDRFADRIRRVDVTFEDVNGPRGGVDVKCHVHVALRDGLDMDVDSLGASPLEAASVALGRVRRGVSRRSARRAEPPRQATIRTMPLRPE